MRRSPRRCGLARILSWSPFAVERKELVGKVKKFHHFNVALCLRRELLRKRLPLRRLGVFDAVARLGSFKAAAAELNLTPSAVSHQIRTLENELGVTLFVRTAHGAMLEPTAATYAERVNGLLRELDAATEEIASAATESASAGAVRVMTPPSLATHWLMPRLPAFIEAHPGLDMRVFAVRTADGNLEDFDLTIGYGDADRYEGRARPFLKEVIQPYCAPSLLGGLERISAVDLTSYPLIHSQENAFSWKAWFSEQGVDLDHQAFRPLEIDPSYVAIEAAVKGVGIILESSLLTKQHVDSGQLIAPIQQGGQASVSYWLSPPRQGARQAVEIAHDWLMASSNLG